ncbi:4Fe-4S dicluster domain-containing protein [Phosphitispora fastidiosa]|uniref:4Fe-4S dicluster domain-containing protein n=1 Tax=Phosphitispora fastidiosa TaxID=2837202 RepID=UPI001E320172|nr:4Fe-4S dicluster domain-containing protein [Phosphitispora fastidiosa]MBU7005374.1 carbon-monoxide dehydrogenase iron sulfur subunit [Phosphitispora fastidiosa]
MKQVMIDISRCLGCKSCELACAVAHSESKSLVGALFEGEKPKRRVCVETGDKITFPLQCRHCEDARCIDACMSGAMFRDAETQTVQVNPDRCVGCWMCVMVCPFGAILQQREENTAIKCDRCINEDVPACVQACPTKAIKFIEIDAFSRDKRNQYLTNFRFLEEGK